MQNRSSVVDLTVAWKVYGEVWPLLDTLKAMSPSEREGLHVGLSPLDEQAVAFVESGSHALLTEDLPPVDVPEDMGGGQIAVAALTIPKRVHVLPYSALQGAKDTEGKTVLGLLRRAYTDAPGNVRPGARLLDLLFLVTRDDFDSLRRQTVIEAATACQAVLDQKGARAMQDALEQANSYVAEFGRIERAEQVRAYWQRHVGG